MLFAVTATVCTIRGVVTLSVHDAIETTMLAIARPTPAYSARIPVIILGTVQRTSLVIPERTILAALLKEHLSERFIQGERNERLTRLVLTPRQVGGLLFDEQRELLLTIH